MFISLYAFMCVHVKEKIGVDWNFLFIVMILSYFVVMVNITQTVEINSFVDEAVYTHEYKN